MCENKISYMMPKGNFGYREYMVECGTTDPYGERAMCDTCYEDEHIRRNAQRQQENSDADNAWLRSAGWGEM
jgi:hypothetical protein